LCIKNGPVSLVYCLKKGKLDLTLYCLLAIAHGKKVAGEKNDILQGVVGLTMNK
jgi:hypothetical protein